MSQTFMTRQTEILEFFWMGFSVFANKGLSGSKVLFGSLLRSYLKTWLWNESVSFPENCSNKWKMRKWLKFIMKTKHKKTYYTQIILYVFKDHQFLTYSLIKLISDLYLKHLNYNIRSYILFLVQVQDKHLIIIWRALFDRPHRFNARDFITKDCLTMFYCFGQNIHARLSRREGWMRKSLKGLWNILKSENFWNVVIITVGLLICGTLTGF